MKEERYSIIFSSKTGNTAELANAIRDALPQENCDYFGTSEIEEPVSEMLYIGFWTDQGNADKSALELLQRIKNKKVFLFGTAGFGENEAYFQKVLNNVKSSMDESNQVVGEYMCQGKMPQVVRDRYVKMKEQPVNWIYAYLLLVCSYYISCFIKSQTKFSLLFYPLTNSLSLSRSFLSGCDKARSKFAISRSRFGI